MVARDFLSACERDPTESFSSVNCKSKTTASSVIPPDFNGVFSFGTALALGCNEWARDVSDIFHYIKEMLAALHVHRPLGKALPHLMGEVTLMGMFTPMKWGLFAGGVCFMLCCC